MRCCTNSIEFSCCADDGNFLNTSRDDVMSTASSFGNVTLPLADLDESIKQEPEPEVKQVTTLKDRAPTPEGVSSLYWFPFLSNILLIKREDSFIFAVVCSAMIIFFDVYFQRNPQNYIIQNYALLFIKQTAQVQQFH